MPTFASPIEETNGESPAQLGTTASPVPLSQDLVDDYPGGFLPAPPRALGSLQPISDHPEERKPPKVFRPLTIRGVTFPHRLWVAPMCMYSSDNGHATDHHFVFTGSMVQRGWQGIMLEATAILPEGRISPDDAGIWSDSHIEPLKRQVDFVHAHKGTIGIQLNHAGRKAGVLVPWMEDRALAGGYKSVVVADSHGGWSDKIIGPSDIPFDAETYALPKSATLEDIAPIKEAFLEAVGRCKQIGFDFIEIHGAHGYLLHQFTDPISNVRTDQYGGSLENRLRLPLEIARAIRQAWDGSLFYRVSATDWLEDHLGPEKGHPGEKEEYSWWGLEQTTVLAHRLAEIGIDLLDVTSGGNDPRPNIVGAPGYQVPFADHIKRHVPGLLVGAVGCITDAHQANKILEKGQADVVFFARTVLNHIDFPLQAAKVLGIAVQPLDQFSAGWVWEAKVKEKHGEESLILSEEDQVHDAIVHEKAAGFAD